MYIRANIVISINIMMRLCSVGLQRNERGDQDDDGRIEEFSGKLPVPPIPTDDDDGRPMAKRAASSGAERPGHPSETHACTTITTVPKELRQPAHMYPNGLDVFYQKYTHAYGIPIIGSANVTDSALQRACYMVRFLLADRADVREMFYRNFGRFGLMAYNEMTSDIPEHKHLKPHDYWDGRARGLGPTPSWPITTGGEENTVCLKADRYTSQDIPLHELAHAVAIIGARYAISDFDKRLNELYAAAKNSSEWRGTYAMTNSGEYWAQAMQSYFNDNMPSLKINNREMLEKLDIGLFQLADEIWPCKNKYLPRCYSSRELEAAQQFKMNCNGTDNPVFDYKEEGCVNQKVACHSWAASGYCEENSKYKSYMMKNCKKSCKLCTLEKCNSTANVGKKVVGKPRLTCSDVAADCNKITCTDNITYAIQQCRKTCTNCERYLGRDFGTFKSSRAADETQCKLGAGRTRCWWPEEYNVKRRCTENGKRATLTLPDGKYRCKCNYKGKPMHENCKKLSA